jgi:hypothetical protein
LVGPGCCLFHEDPIRAYCHWCRPGETESRGDSDSSSCERMVWVHT